MSESPRPRDNRKDPDTTAGNGIITQTEQSKDHDLHTVDDIRLRRDQAGHGKHYTV